jgi:DeoR/GlpR family transcriptional regulator of sugar metabolism
MPSQLFLEERRRRILETLKAHGRVSVAELSASMNVSAVTIRQDMKALEEEGLLERTHGGAVEIQSKANTDERELSFDIRRNKQTEEKDLIGKVAAALVQTGSAIALDASTTVCSVIPHLSRLDSLTIVTNNLMVPELVLKLPQVELFLSGGRLRRDSYSVTGNPQSLPELNLNIGFVSAWGISLEAGLTEVNEGEMKMKQALLARCRMKVVLVDSSKWGRVAPYTYASPNDIDLIITTDRAPQRMLRDFSETQIEIVSI